MPKQDQEAHPYLVAGFAWLICFGVMLFHTLGNVSTLNLLNDDYVRLVQVYDFLDGQGWRDMTQYRLAPPDGVAMHWSRLPDLPLALVIGLGEMVVGRESATKAALVVVSGVYLLALFLLTARLGAAFSAGTGRLAGSDNCSRRLANLTVLYAMFGLYTIVQFVPGRVDHHNLQIVLSLAVLLCATLSLIEGNPHWRRDGMAVTAGFLATLSMAIGLEALPILIAANASYGLLWALGPSAGVRAAAMRAGHQFAIGSAATAVLLTALLAPHGSLLATYCDSLSGTYVALLVLIAAIWLGLSLLRHVLPSRLTRLAAGAILATSAGGLFSALMPHCIAGPYAEVDPLLQDLWLNNVSEAKGLMDLLDRPDRLASTYIYPLLAFASLLWLYLRGRLDEVARYVPLAVFLLIAFLVSLSQARFSSFAQAYAVFPVAILAQMLMAQIPKLTTPVVRVLPTVAIVALLNPLAIIGPVRALTDTPKVQGIDRTDAATCGLPEALTALAGEPRGRILGFTDVGPELLFFTPHEVLAAPYHRNTEGLATTLRFFTSQNGAAARDLAADAGADYVLFCEDLPESQLYQAMGEDNVMARLLEGDVPEWLSAAPTLSQGALRVYRVVGEATAHPEGEPQAKPHRAILERTVE